MLCLTSTGLEPPLGSRRFMIWVYTQTLSSILAKNAQNYYLLQYSSAYFFTKILSAALHSCRDTVHCLFKHSDGWRSTEKSGRTWAAGRMWLRVKGRRRKKYGDVPSLLFVTKLLSLTWWTQEFGANRGYPPSPGLMSGLVQPPPSSPTLTFSIHSWIISICIPTGPGIPQPC